MTKEQWQFFITQKFLTLEVRLVWSIPYFLSKLGFEVLFFEMRN